MIEAFNVLQKYNNPTNQLLINNVDTFLKTNGKEGYRSYYIPNNMNLLVSDTLSELTNTISRKPSNTISKGDKIYFSKECNYPALLVSRLKSQYSLDISRVISENKATKFIFSKNPIKIPEYNWYYTHKVHLHTYIAKSKTIITYILPNSTDLQRINFIKQSLENFYNCKFNFAIQIIDLDSANLFINHLNEAVTVQELIKYTNNFVPKVTNKELDTAFAYLKSTDRSIRSTGINLFEYFNISDKLYEVIKRLCDLYNIGNYLIPYSESDASSSWKYLLQSVDCEISDIKKGFDYNQSYFLRKILNNPINCGDVKAIKEEIKSRLLERLKESAEFASLREDLKLINCELVLHDKDGEANTGD